MPPSVLIAFLSLLGCSVLHGQFPSHGEWRCLGWFLFTRDALPWRVRRYLVFAPSLALGLLGALWLVWRPLELEAEVGLLTSFALGVAVGGGLLIGAWLLEKVLPSFRYASKLMESALLRLPLTLPRAAMLAGLTATAEELFFRGALLSLLGVWGQAVVFGLMHPAPLRAWSYTAYTFVAGLAFGYATLYTGNLWAAIVAHFAVNLHGFLSVYRSQRRSRRALHTLLEPTVNEHPE